MKQLVITYDTGDGYNSPITTHTPVLYESAAQLAYDMEDAFDLYDKDFFAKLGIDMHDFVLLDYNTGNGDEPCRKFETPDIHELAEWFEFARYQGYTHE
jgi:hypothetical protein